MKKITITIIILGLLLVAGCQQQVPTKNETTSTPGEKVYCTEEQKQVSMCTADYNPVCGSDDVTYPNKCTACVEEGVGYYTVGECKPIACTEEAKICPDGTSVGRTGPNCEFAACPEINTGKKYVVQDAEQCKLVKFMCVNGTRPFFDEKGCGCEPANPEREYVSTNVTVCAASTWICKDGMQQFFDETGCGCEPGNATIPTDGKLQAIDCIDPRPTACTKEYMPVCGQVQVECIRAPCPHIKETFGNKCMACANQRTISYTEGECRETETPTDMPALRTYCRPEQRGENIACTMDYNPVCGSNGITYGNACGACANKDVEFHTSGECK